MCFSLTQTSLTPVTLAVYLLSRLILHIIFFIMIITSSSSVFWSYCQILEIQFLAAICPVTERHDGIKIMSCPFISILCAPFSELTAKHPGAKTIQNPQSTMPKQEDIQAQGPDNVGPHLKRSLCYVLYCFPLCCLSMFKMF